MLNDLAYVKGIWLSRYFWLHLALSDIRFRYRRSLLGLAWAVIQPLALTLLLSFVMSSFFHAEMNDYAPFIFSGLIFWEFISNSAVNGCNGFINAEGYIKQFSHPLLIYSLRIIISCSVNLFCGFVGLVLWILFWKPSNIGINWLELLTAFPLIFLLAWPICTITAFIGTRFRDFSQLILIILQGIFYISPIFFLPKIFYSVKIGYLLEINPIYHLLNLFRKPLLEGSLPSLHDYLYVMGTSLFLWICVWFLVRRNENKIIFYL